MLQIANRDQVACSDCAHVGVMQTYERMRIATDPDKLDLKTVRVVNVDNGTKIAATQATLGQVPIQDDGVEQVEHGWLVDLAVPENAYELIDNLSREFGLTHRGKALLQLEVAVGTIEVDPLDLTKVYWSG